ncbi:hypothetical protein DY000_02030034 [Brassica cretica]|uniref:Uncharacterized protein n=1 Tax=Brassica cretica TaxID=69181 RepID=A0ABQ7DJZ2_BRACR|nr:hypothetical protein DY000_02030034 [Brassica cretica]
MVSKQRQRMRNLQNQRRLWFFPHFLKMQEDPCWPERSTVSMLSSIKQTPWTWICGLSSAGKPTAVAA